MDRIPPTRRSEIMSRIRGKDTAPEMMVRRLLHGLGYRFRLHRRALPGCPDLVLPKYNAILFIHGCFWHQHHGCKQAHLPKTRSEWWRQKLGRNVERDRRNLRRLAGLGWRVLVLWECEINRNEDVRERLLRFLADRRYSG
jgi:DNA mismatch endonuclease, patch repair protein